MQTKNPKEKDWSNYYDKTREKPPASLLVKAIDYLQEKENISTLDIGAGVLKDTRYLLSKNFNVTSLDSSSLIFEESKDLDTDKLDIVQSKFEDFDFGIDKYNLVNAMNSLSFIHPDEFNKTFEKIKNSLKKEGILVCNFFGDKDGWIQNPEMTFHKGRRNK